MEAATNIDQEVPPQGGEPVLAQEHRQKLDSIVIDLYKKKAPKEVVQAIVKDFKTKYAKQPVAQPTNTGITPDATKDPNYLGLVGVPSIEEAAQIAKEKHDNAVLSSQKTVSGLLDNDESIKKIAKSILDDQVKRKVGEEVSKGLRQEPYQQFNFDMNPVKEEHIQGLAESIKATPSMQVDALMQAKKIMPEKAKDIDKSLYILNSTDRAISSEKQNQISENADKIQKGELIYKPKTGQLIKPEDLGESLHTASKRRNDDMDLFDLADNGSREDLIKKLNELVINQDPDVPTPQPSGFGGKIGEFAGGQGKITAQAFAAQAANLVAPGSGEVLAAGLYAHEFARRGFSNELQRSYAAFKKQGLSDDEALDKAETQAKVAMTTDAATAAIMGKATSSAGSKLLNSATVKEAVKLGNEGGWYNGVIKNGFDFIKKEAPAGIKNASLAGGGELAKNISANVGGQDRDVTEGVLGAAGNMLALHYTLSAGMGLLGHFGSKGIDATKPIYKKVMQGFTKVPIEDAKIIAAEQIQAGNITPQDAVRVLEDIEAHKELDDLIPKSVKNDEVRLQLQDIVKKREATAEEKSKVSAAFAEPLKLKIEKYDEKINEIVNSPEAKQESPAQPATEKTAADLFITAAANGDVKGTYAEMVKSDPKQADAVVKDIAEQAQGVDSEGKPLPGGARYEDMVKDYPKEIIDAAIKEYPKKKPVVTVSTPNIVNVKFKEQPPVEPEAQVTPVINEGELTGVTHAETDAVAKELGLPTYEEKPETILEWDAEAAKRIKEDPETVNRLLNKLQKGIEPDKIEQRVMAKYLASLKAKFNETHSDEVMNEYARAKKLSDEIGGREVGKSLVARKALEPVEDSLTDFVYREMEDNNAGLPLSEKQKETVTKEYEDFKAKKDAFEAHMKSKEAEFTKREAELKIQEEVKKIKSTKTGSKKGVKKTPEEYKAEMTSYVEQLKELKAAAEKKLKDKGIQTMGVNFTFTGDMAKIVGKMVKLLAEKGVDKLEDFVKHIHGQLKDVFEGIEERDVHDIIAGKYNDKKETRNEVAAKVQDIKTEAKLINEYSDLLFGKEPVKESAAKRRNITLEELRKKIKSLSGEYKEPVEPEAKEAKSESEMSAKRIEKLEAELQSLKEDGLKEPAKRKVFTDREIELKKQISEEKLKIKEKAGIIEKSKVKAIKTRLQNELEKQQEKLKSGNIEPDVKKDPIKLDAEGLKLKDEVLKAREDIDIRRMKQMYEKRSAEEKIGRVIDEAITSARVLQTSFDVSMPFRQGLWGVAKQALALPIGENLTFKQQRQLIGQFGKMYKAVGSPTLSRRIMANIHESPRFADSQKAGLHLEDPLSKFAEERLDTYGPAYINRVPFVGAPVKLKGGGQIGGLTMASERGATVFVNSMKWDVYNNFVNIFEKQGKTFENSKDLYKAAAVYSNQVVGRGKLPIAIDKATPITKHLFFSLRLQASRLQLLTNFLNPVFYAKTPAAIRNAYLKDMVKFVALGTTVLGIAHAAGLKVGVNPYASDFGKIHVGDTQYDIWGGFSQWAVFLTRLIRAKSTDSHGKTKDFGTGMKDENRLSLLMRFARSKSAPEASFTWNTLEGKDYLGRETNVGKESLKLISPMLGQDIFQAYQDGGVQKAVITAVLAAHGVGTQTYDNNKPTTKSTKKPTRQRNNRDRTRK